MRRIVLLLAIVTFADSAPAAESPALQMAALDRKLADLDAEEQATKKELSDLGPSIADARGRVVRHGKAFYKLTRAGMLPMGGGFDALVSHAMRVERARRLLVADVDAERKARERGAELARAIERIAKDRVSFATQRTALDTQRVQMEDESRRAQAFDRAFSTSTGAGDYVAVYSGAALDPGAASAGGFAASRGRLLFPVAGRAEARPAHREGTGGPGLEIRAALGAPVRAAFAGRVAFADRYGPYGKLVILDHGDHYYTVSGNLAAIDVKVGDEVGAGERVGTVGDDGHGALLYFEVRKGTETIAPGPWLGL